MSNIVRFRSRKDVTTFLKTKGIDTTNWTEEKWLSLNNSQTEIHMQALAESMWDVMNESTPKPMKPGEWHIPYKDKIELTETQKWLGEESYKIKIAVARIARLSYANHDGKIDYTKDVELHDRLLRDKHFSPFEHIAKAMNDYELSSYFKGRAYVNQNEPNYIKLNEYWAKHGGGWCDNFRGWISYRHLIQNNA